MFLEEQIGILHEHVQRPSTAETHMERQSIPSIFTEAHYQYPDPFLSVLDVIQTFQKKGTW